MIVRTKHYVLSIISLLFVIFVYWVNFSWGNSSWRSLQLAFWTFWLIFLLFAFYWEIRDFWQFRWYQADRTNITAIPLMIPISNSKKSIQADYLCRKTDFQSSEPISSSSKPLIIFSHGFSDDRIKSSYISIPLVLMNYDLIVYDARGAGKSRKVGNKNQFDKIIEDLGEIINFIHNQSEFNSHPIFLVGFSLGAMASIIQGIQFPFVKKIIAIAGMSDFHANFSFSPMPFKASWWVWARYQLFGVPVNPTPELNAKISPILHLQAKQRETNNDTIWKDLMKQTLFLIHAQNDPIININNFNENREVCDLPIENWFLTQKGGHMFRRYELALLGAIEYTLKQN